LSVECQLNASRVHVRFLRIMVGFLVWTLDTHPSHFDIISGFCFLFPIQSQSAVVVAVSSCG